MRQRVFVTGGAGYIGSHTAQALHLNGYEVVCLDNLVYGHREFVKWGPLEVVDILDSASLEEVFTKYQPIHAVLHFAAFAYVGESVAKPEKYYRNNIQGSLNLFETALKYKVPYAVFSSTCAIYGVPEYLPLTEEHPQNPISPYGFTKLAIERLLRDFDTAYNLKSVCLRYFNAAGASANAEPGFEIGEDHNPESHLIPLIFDAARGKKEHIGIFGTDYDTADGTAIRDYIHVDDLADAHVKALKYLEQGGASNFFNLGNGNGFSVQEVIDKAVQVMGAEFPIKIKREARRPGDPASLISKNEKAKKILNWHPGYPELEKILRDAWHWHLLRFQD